MKALILSGFLMVLASSKALAQDLAFVRYSKTEDKSLRLAHSWLGTNKVATATNTTWMSLDILWEGSERQSAGLFQDLTYPPLVIDGPRSGVTIVGWRFTTFKDVLKTPWRKLVASAE